MDLKQLQYLVTCAQAGSFSDAAKILYSTQSSVSKVIRFIIMPAGSQMRLKFWKICRQTA